MPRLPVAVWVGAGAGLALLVYLRSKATVGAAVGQAAIGAAGVAGDATAEVVQAAGEKIGIPRTDASQCAQDKASGSVWAATFSCPALDLFSGWGVGATATPSEQSIFQQQVIAP